jgi:hypothetical protein
MADNPRYVHRLKLADDALAKAVEETDHDKKIELLKEATHHLRVREQLIAIEDGTELPKYRW